MIKQAIQTHKHLLSQVMRFTIVGMSSTVVHFSSVMILVALGGMRPLIANIFAFLIAFSVSFFGHQLWTFAGTTQSFRRSFPRFLTIALTSFALNEAFYWYLLHRLHMQYAIALIIVLSCVSVLTFTASKLWAFHSRETI
ncbi:MAG: GtrA family protein [Coxiellaceae bacterium]|nr:GtrA family protein [Coxiellaceae bacterium]